MAIELGQFDIEYRPRVAIKAQVLEDFIAEFTYLYKEEEPPMETWTVQMDGSVTRKVGGILKYAVRLQFPVTNNEAEYEVLLIGLSLAKVLRAKNLSSKLILS